MLQTITNTVVPVLITALIAVLIALIKGVGDAMVKLIEQKTAAVKAKIGADTYAQRLAFARQAWGVTDEYFRITPTATKTIESAQAKFAAEIKKLIPDITDEEIAQLRQAVAGEVNKGRAAIEATDTVTPSTTNDAPTTENTAQAVNTVVSDTAQPAATTSAQ